MFNIFQLKNNYLFRVKTQDILSSINNAIWVDIIQSQVNEYQHIQNILKQNKIDFFKFNNVDKNCRFFCDENHVHIRSFFLEHNDQNQINNVVVFFIICNDCLYTLRSESNLSVFCMYQEALHNHILIDGNAYELLLSLFEVKLDDLTDKIENIYSTLETLSFIIMGGLQIEEYDGILANLVKLDNMSWKIRINLLDTERTIRFLIRQVRLPVTQERFANEMLNDIAILLPYNDCIFQKISFLVQSVMGLINIEQNRIIKIFSIVFLPPTLIASSYGMNFEFMPELKWSFGYPSAIVLMILTGLAPYLYFKYKNWL